MPKVTIESTSNQDNVQNCLKFIKKNFKKFIKHFMLSEELNCRIHENG